jgi:hypothetical protein
MQKNFSLELFDFNESLSPYGTIDTNVPESEIFTISDFTEGTHNRTQPDTDKTLILALEKKLISIILDQSGSLSWNDNTKTRFEYIIKLLEKLNSTYPKELLFNLIKFNGILTKSKILACKSGDFELSLTNSFELLLKNILEDSVYDFSGVRIVRRDDRFPIHAADGVIVQDGIFDAFQDNELTESTVYYYGIWTYNKYNQFSNGQFIKVSPISGDKPNGLGFVNIESRILPGIKRDAFTKLIYSFLENKNNIVFDSSANGNHGTISSNTILSNFWNGDLSTSSYLEGSLKNKNGVKFDGSFDYIETEHQEYFLINSNNITLNFWIFPFTQSSINWVIGTSSATTAAWAIGLNADNEIVLTFNTLLSSSFGINTGVILDIKQWQMVTACCSNSSQSIYVNGELKWTGLYSVNNVGTYKLYIGGMPFDSTIDLQSKDFFGCLSQISLSNTIRDITYIQNLYGTESNIFNSSRVNYYLNQPDNTQRENLLNWIIGDEFNYENGTVKIVRKYNSIPSHDQDGDVLNSFSASKGEFFYLDCYDFIHSGNYYYRFFTYQNNGLPCFLENARVLSVQIPKSNQLTTVNKVTNVQALKNTNRVFLQWNNPSGAVGTKIYFSDKQFPTVAPNEFGQTIVSGGVLAIDTTLTYFIHRSVGKNCNGTDINLQDGKEHYYLILAYDILGNFSEPVYTSIFPGSSDIIFPPEDISNISSEIINNKSIVLRWKSPTFKSNRLDLYFNESATIFAQLEDINGNKLTDLNNVKLIFCTKIEDRDLKNSVELDGQNGLGDYSTLFNPSEPCSDTNHRGFSVELNENCNSEQEIQETVITYSAVNAGLVQGLLTHINDKNILSRRKRYSMNVFAQYSITNNVGNTIFKYSTDSVSVSFSNPLKISAINKNHRYVIVNCTDNLEPRAIDQVCICEDEEKRRCEPKYINGAYVNSTIPYVCRIEFQYKGEALPEGTSVNVQLFKHDESNSLSVKSDRTTIDEGSYPTTVIETDQLDSEGNPTGNIISKSILDFEIPCPSLPDHVDLYVSLEFNGILIDVIHEVKFVSSLFIKLNGSKPDSNGIDTAEQIASVYQIDPDDLTQSNFVNVPDNTIVKWELVPLRNGKNRPFYSTDVFNFNNTGIYSKTKSGIARKVFFGPVGNLEKNFIELTCKDEDGAIISADRCCLAEEYEIKASVILDDLTAFDAIKFGFSCDDRTRFLNRKFLLNGSNNQFIDVKINQVHYWTWADGEHYIKFEIAQDPSIDEVKGRACFVDCLDSLNGQFLPIPNGHIVQITAPGDIIWDAVFTEDPYTNQFELLSYKSASINDNEVAVANIPINGSITEFYVKLNKFIGEGILPKPQICDSSNSSDLGSDDISPCEWRNICRGISVCNPVEGKKWDNVSVVEGTTTLIINNKEITLTGGGDYENGLPPVYVGWQEPLSLKIVDARVNGERIREIITDNISKITFVAEVTFSGKSVPDGTPVKIVIEDQAGVVRLSNCDSQDIFCFSSVNGISYITNVNDYILNPDGDKRSLCYFTIEPMPNIEFSGKINVICNYDKSGTVSREIIKCITLTNNLNTENEIEVPSSSNNNNPDSVDNNLPSSNEVIVYDFINNTFENLNTLLVDRLGAFSELTTFGSNNYIFVFGGYSNKGQNGISGITKTSEKYDFTLQKWEFITDIPTARAYGASVQKGNKIYCIGGIESSANEQLVCSKKIECYLSDKDIWITSLAQMPEPVAFGCAVSTDDEYIYVFCGVQEIESNQPSVLNNKIFKYSILNDSWITINVNNDDYKRISPFYLYRNIDTGSGDIYFYGGSVLKTQDEIESERVNRINEQIRLLRSYISGSSWFLNLSVSDQNKYITEQETVIRNSIVVAAYFYPNTGFRFVPNSEEQIGSDYYMTLHNLDEEWPTTPVTRDFGKCFYDKYHDTAYFVGGSNQNKSTTLSDIDTIIFNLNNFYDTRNNLPKGISHFSLCGDSNNMYLIGGLKSGHKIGWTQIDIIQTPDLIECTGKQSAGMLISLRNDSGDFITQNVKVNVKGRLSIPELDESIQAYYANLSVSKILAGEDIGTELNPSQLSRLQNSVLDPNSDEFQINSAKSLKNEIDLLPVLYSNNEIVIKNGIGTVVLKERSEDPFTEFKKISEFITSVLQNTPENFTLNEDQEKIAALGEALGSYTYPPISIQENYNRDLYKIESKITILDDFLFGETVSTFDIETQNAIRDLINEALTPHSESPNPEPSNPILSGKNCLILENSSNQNETEPTDDTQPTSPNTPYGNSSFHNSGQCLFCANLVPVKPTTKNQNNTVVTQYFNNKGWVPQIVTLHSFGSYEEVHKTLSDLKYEIPFGSSQLYDALNYSSLLLSNEDYNEYKKSVFVLSDNLESLSLSSLDTTIDNINSIEGDKQVPVSNVILSTSYPITISSLFQRIELQNLDKISNNTGGSSFIIVSDNFIYQVLNATLNASGGLGSGQYYRRIQFDEPVFIDTIYPYFFLPLNTFGSLRFRYSADGYNFNDWSDKIIGSTLTDIKDIVCKILDFEIILSSGFSSSFDNNVTTGIPRLSKLELQISKEKVDYIYLEPESIVTNPAQIGIAVDAVIPEGSTIELGVATFDSVNWNDYQSIGQPSVKESGKIYLLQRSNTGSIIVGPEKLIYTNGYVYKTNYGPWEPSSIFEVYQVVNNKETLYTAYKSFPREGIVRFYTKQSINNVFVYYIKNLNILKVGMKIRNRNSKQSVSLSGVGYIYSTNREVLPALSQVAPTSINVVISPITPTSLDIISAKYDYRDLNLDKENGTIISWYKNNKQLFEIQNKSSWSNSDLLLSNKLIPNDKIQYSVQPSDGKTFGNKVYSPTVTISAIPPSALNIKIIPVKGSVINDRYDTSSYLVADYDFETQDESTEEGTLIRWYVNNLIFKEGLFSATNTDPYSNPKVITTDEVSAAIRPHTIGNLIQVEVTPKTALATGNTVKSAVITIVNSIPSLSDVVVSPSNPNTQSVLQLSYNIIDTEIQLKTQTDQSQKKWFRSLNGTSFEEIVALKNYSSVTANYLSAGQYWYCEVTPFDGLDLGVKVKSNTVIIRA